MSQMRELMMGTLELKAADTKYSRISQTKQEYVKTLTLLSFLYSEGGRPHTFGPGVTCGLSFSRMAIGKQSVQVVAHIGIFRYGLNQVSDLNLYT